MKRGAYRRQKIGVHLKNDTTPVPIDYDELWRLQVKYKQQALAYRMERLKEDKRKLEQEIRTWRKANDPRAKEASTEHGELLDQATAESGAVG